MDLELSRMWIHVLALPLIQTLGNSFHLFDTGFLVCKIDLIDQASLSVVDQIRSNMASVRSWGVHRLLAAS